MTGILELSDEKLKTTMITERWDSKNEPKRNAIGQKLCNIIKNVFIGLTSRLNMSEERISKLEVISIETSKVEKQREKGMKRKKKKQNRISMNCESSTKDMTYT